ncbi:unnamed protein product [Lactuca virosa]|uniref:Uncharacterized protein n=1 Tax=Lactuca virosa TaxID=75947 RepID=A0AAU9NVE2_9ASTR|nr:unnamed protein product [Lactuca virosa]
MNTRGHKNLNFSSRHTYNYFPILPSPLALSSLKSTLLPFFYSLLPPLPTDPSCFRITSLILTQLALISFGRGSGGGEEDFESFNGCTPPQSPVSLLSGFLLQLFFQVLIATINDTDCKYQWELLAPTKEDFDYSRSRSECYYKAMISCVNDNIRTIIDFHILKHWKRLSTSIWKTMELRYDYICGIESQSQSIARLKSCKRRSNSSYGRESKKGC